MNINNKTKFILILLLCLMFLSASSAYKGTGFNHNIPSNYYDSYSAQDILNKYNNTYLTSEEKSVCTKVVDGDTIYLSNGKKVRFVGVNTPERGVNGYLTSKRFVEKLCLNKEVGINIDDRKYRDKYGRTLAVVIVDGKNLNEMLLKEHLAEVMYIPPSEFSPYKWAGSDQVTSYTSQTSTQSSSSPKISSNEQTQKSVTTTSSNGYIGNLNSHKFHNVNCEGASKMSQKNKIFFKSRSEAINSGYVPCKICNP